jgi:hypothetical protein
MTLSSVKPPQQFRLALWRDPAVRILAETEWMQGTGREAARANVARTTTSAIDAASADRPQRDSGLIVKFRRGQGVLARVERDIRVLLDIMRFGAVTRTQQPQGAAPRRTERRFASVSVAAAETVGANRSQWRLESNVGVFSTHRTVHSCSWTCGGEP